METQSPDRTATSPTRVPTTNIPQPTPISEPVIDLESEETSAPIRDSSWPRPLKELEKEKAKTSVKSTPKPDSRPAPATQSALSQEQQQKKKKPRQQQPQVTPEEQQQQQQQQQTSEKPQKPQHQRQTPGASPPPKPTQVVFGTTSSTPDKQVIAVKQTTATSSAIQSGQAKPKLSTANDFIEAWNAVDLAPGFSAATPHPAGPSRMMQSLHSVKVAFTASHQVFEVSLPNLAFSSS